MNKLISVIFLLNVFISNAQESIGAIINLPKEKKTVIEKSGGTFDSTFIFLSDTLTLPFLDDFSSKRIQNFQADFNDSDVTYDKVYKVLNTPSNLPIDKNEFYTTQQTYVRTVAADSSYTDVINSSLVVKLGDLSSYPVNYLNITVYPPFYVYDSLGVIGDISDTVWVLNPEIYQDSATQFFKQIKDNSKFWLDSFAYHNYTYGQSPWTLGVMTFDGLDAEGVPYQIGSSISGYADELTSKPIDLSSYTAADSIYLSFLYQAGAYGETPDITDSILLHFYVKSTNTWENVWTKPGYSGDTSFRIAHLPIKNAKYFTDAFQFKFKNYGSLAGSFDHFHIDYVHLRALSGWQDTLFKDFAWVYPVQTLLDEYSSVPWDHFKNKLNHNMGTDVKMVIRNGSNISENNSLQGNLVVFYNGVFENSINFSGASLSNGDLNYEPRTTYFSYHDFSSESFQVNNKTSTSVSYDVEGVIAAQYPNEAVNDTMRFSQYFGNYYSYDDGSAEVAYGIIGSQSSLAVFFDAYEADTLLGLSMNFVQTANDVSDKLFLLTIWDDNNGKPGTILYQDDLFFPQNPRYVLGNNNGFINYYFNNGQVVPVGNKFYVGWKQFDTDRLNIGFDKNTKKNEKVFYSLNQGITWNTSAIEGVPMIRPIVSTGMNKELGLNELENEDVLLYPNPVKDFLNYQFNSGKIDFISVKNVQGQEVKFLQDVTGKIDLTDLKNGAYFIEFSIGNQFITKKIIKL